ncbi:MAG: extracellular solute-binding protein [Cellulosilyticaceae bacterium]
MKSKKLMSVLIAMTVTSSMFVGCSPSKQAETTTPAPEKTEVSATEAPKEETKEGDSKFPIVDKPVTYRIVATTQPGQADFGDMEFFKKLEEKTNVKIEWECYEAVTYGDQKNLMLAANQLPDAFLGYGSFTMDDVNKYGPLGTVIPLDDLMAENAPNYMAKLEENDLLNGMSKAHDGNRYSFGTVIEQEVRNYPDNLHINKTWLDKLGLEVPTTLDEYYEVLKAFKEGDPNGNGLADEIPYTFTKYNHITGYGSFFGAFGMVDVHNGSGVTPLDHFIIDENEKVIFTANKPEYKEAIMYLSKFFQDGLFDKEGFVQEQSQFNAKMKDPVGVVGSFYGWANSAVAVETMDQYIPIKPLIGPSGEEPHVKRRQNHINVMGTGFSITSNAKDPEILVKWVDTFYEELQTLESNYGNVGTGLIDLGNGKYDYNKELGKDKGVNYLDMWKEITPGDGAPKYLTWAMQGDIIPYNDGDLAKINAINEFYIELPQDRTLPNINFTTDEIKLNTSIGMDVSNYVKENQSRWLIGEGNIEADWDAYVAQLEKLGLSQYEEQMQKAYNRTIGR